MYDGVIVRRQTAPLGDHGTVINIVSWMLLVVSGCTLIARFAMKFTIKDKSRRWGLDDLFIAIAALASIGHTTAISIEAMQAISQRYTTLTQHQVTVYEKTDYVGCILYIANLGCARISLCILIRKILPGRTARITTNIFAAFTLLWISSGILVTAFPCSLPKPWENRPTKKCVNMVTWVNYVGITNIIAEVFLVSIPLCVWNLRTSAGRRISVSCVILARLSLVAAFIVQLAFFANDAWSVAKHWRPLLCVQIAQNLSIITACLPYLHPFIIKILAGKIRAERLQFEYPTPRKYREFMEQKLGYRASKSKFDSMSSQASSIPPNEKKGAAAQEAGLDYCRPLETYGLDTGSSDTTSRRFERKNFKKSTAPLSAPKPMADIFNMPVPIPDILGPSTSHDSFSQFGNSPHASPFTVPKDLSDVGILPMADWDSESNDSKGETPKYPDREYMFRRSTVISVPEEMHLREHEAQYCKQYFPPEPDVVLPQRPPRHHP